MLLVIGLVVGAVIALVSLGIGVTVGVEVEQSRKPKMVTPPNPNICGCKHHKSYHEDGTGRCHYDDGYEDCECRHFVSDQPTDPFLEAAQRELTIGNASDN